jgi:hypothetical protein
MMRLVIADGLFMIMLVMVYDLFMMLVMVQACYDLASLLIQSNFLTSQLPVSFAHPCAAIVCSVGVVVNL